MVDAASLTGQERLAAIIADESNYTLDEVMRRDPHARPFTDEELMHFVKNERSARSAIEIKKEKKDAE